MSKDKISAQDIIDSIAQKADVTKALADDFFRAFVAVIEEGLLANDSVKIKDFGTFKLNWIAPRKSVNVQTGEDILIDGYYKVVFTPEKGLKELVNQPFAHLEPVVLDGEPAVKPKEVEEVNPLAVLSEQVDEIKGLLSEISSMSASVDSEVEVLSEEVEEQISIDPVDEPLLPVEEEKEGVGSEEETEVEAPLVDVGEILPVAGKKRRLLPRLLLAVVLVFGLVTVTYFFCMPVQHWINKVVFGYDTASYDAMREKSNLSEDWMNKVYQPEVDRVVEVDTFREVFDQRLENREYMATEKLNSGSRLAYLAERYYGSPYFWVYIYEANMESIPDPDHVKEGAVVRIPKIDSLLLDLNNPRSMEVALELRKKYLKEEDK